MIIDYRAYSFRPADIQTFLELFEKEGLPPQKRILGGFVGMMRHEAGPMEQLIHLWSYDNVSERERRRALCAADPEFQAYVKKARALIVSQDVRILNVMPYSPLARLKQD